MKLLNKILLLVLLSFLTVVAGASYTEKSASGDFLQAQELYQGKSLVKWLSHQEKIKKLGWEASGCCVAPNKNTTKASIDVKKGTANEVGVLRDANKGKGNFGLGSGTRADADKLGRDWVGNGYRVASDGKTLISKDGLRQYRPPTYKPRIGKTQANFERKLPGQKSNQWQSNGHLDITD